MNKKLAYLMKIIGMTEERLGNALNVDSSLINKWKNGSRKIAPGYLDILLNALSEAVKKAEKAVQKRAEYLMMPNLFTVGVRKSIEEYLLNDSVPLYTIEDTQKKVFSYIYDNLEEAAERFFQDIKEGKGGSIKICLASADDLLPQITEGIASALKMQIKTDVILCAAGKGAELFDLLDLTFGKGCTLYATNKTEEYKGFFMYKQGPALTYFRAEDERNSYCEYFFGGVRAAYLAESFAKHRGGARTIFSKASLEECAAAYKKQSYAGTTYIISALPELLLLSRETLTDILRENGIEGAGANNILDDYLSIKNIFLRLLQSGGVCVAFYPFEKEKLEQFMRSGILSAIAKKEIFIRGKQMNHALEENRRALKGYSAYTERRIMQGVLPEKFGCLVREYGAAVVWKHGGSTRFYLAEDPLCAGVVCRSAQAIWSELPAFTNPPHPSEHKRISARQTFNRI